MLAALPPDPGTKAEALIRGLGRRYWFVLSCVAAIVILDQAVVQPRLSQLNGFAPTINVAGRQRMLSQRIAKTALALSSRPGETERTDRLEELQQAVTEWERAHVGLQQGEQPLQLRGTSPADIRVAFLRIAPHYEAIRSAAGQLLSEKSSDHLEASIARILDHEGAYLEGMHLIVGLYERDVQTQVRWLRRLRLMLGAGILLLLSALGRYVLAPAVGTIRDQVELLSESEARHRLLIERMRDGLAVFDQVGRLSYVNRRFTELMDRRSEELLGLPLPKLACGEDREKLIELLDQTGSAASDPVEISWLRPGGEPLIALTAASRYITERPTVSQPGSTVYFAVLTDITSQKQAALSLQQARDQLEVRVQERTCELEQSHDALTREMTDRQLAEDRSRQLQSQLAHTQRLTSIGQLATGLAHELNQPLGAVVNYAEAASLLLERPEPNRQAALSALQRISSTALRAGNIVRRMRNFVRSAPAHRSRVSWRQLINDVVDICEPEARRCQVTMECRVTADKQDEVDVDSVQIQQVLVNLIQNAQQAMCSVPSGARRLMILCAKAKDTWEVSVEDTGPGLTTLATESLFQPFVTTKSDGLGMGLAISRSIVEAHHGTLHAVNTGHGARFTIRLPRVCADVPEPPIADHCLCRG
ncbi:MAG: ATP-binding protein [Planctomycetaceae bacterium]